MFRDKFLYRGAWQPPMSYVYYIAGPVLYLQHHLLYFVVANLLCALSSQQSVKDRHWHGPML